MLFLFQKSSQMESARQEAIGDSLKDYHRHIKEVAYTGGYSADESSINLPVDERMISEVERVRDEIKTDSLKYILVVGIGGSNLGAKAVYDAHYGHFDTLEDSRFPKFIFADTTDPEFMMRVVGLLENISDPEEVAVNIISKSGSTTETIANAECILEVLRRRFVSPEARVVVTTDEGSPLWESAEERGIATLAIPKVVGGRYSVFSAVGLLPLALGNVDIHALLRGARDMRKSCLDDSIQDNPAMASASALFNSYEKGFTISDNFVFHPELESLGKWYRQLMGESIGKECNLSGEQVFAGMTPTVSVGSTDLHSVGQLYLGGPRNKVTTFIYTKKSSDIPTVPENRFFPHLVEMVNGKNARDIMTAILEGVKTAYTEKNLPFMEVMLEDLSEYEVGQFLQFKMMEMMYLGKLMNVNAFNQPNVESYKDETRKILEGRLN